MAGRYSADNCCCISDLLNKAPLRAVDTNQCLDGRESDNQFSEPRIDLDDLIDVKEMILWSPGREDQETIH